MIWGRGLTGAGWLENGTPVRELVWQLSKDDLATLTSNLLHLFAVIIHKNFNRESRYFAKVLGFKGNFSRVLLKLLDIFQCFGFQNIFHINMEAVN